MAKIKTTLNNVVLEADSDAFVALAKDYQSNYSLVTSFSNQIKEQLDELLKIDSISLSIPLQSRIKEWTSIAEKLERKALELTNIRELNDLIGLRIILQFQRDIDKVCSLVRSNFNVIEEYDTRDRLKEDQFGYSSYHFIIELQESWLSVPTMGGMRGLHAELQIRTTAQHIWAAASHTLQYKHEDSVPPSIKRAIHRVSALLETVDLEFERVLQQRDEYSEIPVSSGSNEDLNVDLLEKILDTSLPENNKWTDREDYADLLEDLKTFDINTVTDLAEIITVYYDQVMTSDQETAAKFSNADKDRTSPYSKKLLERSSLGYYFSHTGLVRKMMRLKFGNKFIEYQGNKDTRQSNPKE